MDYRLIPKDFLIDRFHAIKSLRETFISISLNDCTQFLEENLNKEQIVCKHDQHFEKLELCFNLEILEEVPDIYERQEMERKANQILYDKATKWVATLDDEAKKHIEIIIKMNQTYATG